MIGKLEVFFIMQQTGAYFDAIYECILHLSKISAMFWITIFRYVDKTWNTRELKRMNLFDNMQSHTLIKKFLFSL